MTEQREGWASRPSLKPPMDGAEQRLDLILAELRAIRALLTPPPMVELQSDVVELKEPRSRRRGG